MHAKHEKPGEEEIAQDRVTEKHPAGRGAILRQTDSERLDQAGEILGVAWIAQPGERIRDDVKQDRAGERRGQKRFPRAAICDRETEKADNDERQITAADERIEQRRAVVNVQDDIGNEERNERNREFLARREISRAA